MNTKIQFNFSKYLDRFFVFKYFDKEDIKMSIRIHLSCILSLILNSFSSYLDDKKLIRSKIKSEQYINIKTVNLQDYNKIIINSSPQIENTMNDNVSIEQNKIQNTTIQNNISIAKINDKKLITSTKDNKKNKSVNNILTNNLIDNNISQNILKDTLNANVNNEISDNTVSNSPDIATQTFDINGILEKMNNYDSTQINSSYQQELISNNRKFNNIKHKNNISNNTINSINILSIIEQKFEYCWNKYSVGRNNNDITIEILIYLDIGGNVMKYEDITNMNVINNKSEYNIMKKLVDSAINDCNKIDNLPKNQYDEWKKIHLNFQYSK